MEKIKIDLLDFKDKDREDFFSDLKQYLYVRFLGYDDFTLVILFIVEAVKNIYDHSDCKGILMLNFKENEVIIVITSISKNFDFQKSKEVGFSTKKESKENKGLGLAGVLEIASKEFIVIKIIQKKDRLTYVGRWKI